MTPIMLLASESPLIVWFGYFPRSHLVYKIKLPENISRKNKKISKGFYIGSGRYFGTYETQKHYLLQNFYKELDSEFTNIQCEYRCEKPIYYNVQNSNISLLLSGFICKWVSFLKIAIF